MSAVGLGDAERPCAAFARLQRARAVAWMLPHGPCRADSLDDEQIAVLERRIACGPVVDATDLMAIAQELAFQHDNDPALTDPALIRALIGGLSRVCGVQPIQIPA